MKDLLPDLCDQYEDQLTLLDLPLQNFGQRGAFWGEIVTVRCYHDNSKVKEALNENGKGKVLVVDGNGSSKRALMGDQVALTAINNQWEGVVIWGAVRDVGAMSEMDLGVKALTTCPFKTEKRDIGEIDVGLTIQGQMIQPGDYLYSDWNGIVISKKELKVT
ncbi:Regulator of ribonuclease activity A [Vibrio nigripulchritudo SFn27]|uniref:4-hydroxy-4-methyl-2-oxoglutarate aldolase n=1 Tax=Vibrio nigripulchritudo TaxID=28173 RepID=U4K1H3_9VIBR|nr:putative 4-hydroxy-4-methyl-2-oxoglutarate aldolase [Vibrio nigripulchritudo]CCN80501.1 Regulator of ribonuclease activity A [Vibrio nigripulchritudo BLFn1]CCN88247.1 Regulator of ribonuclease activity A [Vibrio nigripulchritudo SFn27]CCN95603.1 Regulator of ribonuclease activity A [Vibrio nigripulchritudo ENn2]CCO42063.1 Regulator of ribonuclease activity A [Vibrio nigripulchritudo SFn135]CCO50483.1 Regulator of ribonuclease activity A [Vibrio nigripulchritudo Wn13]